MEKEITAITRKWGNSIAIVIPNEIVKNQHISENQEVKFTVERKRPKAGILWGFGKGRFKKSAQEIKDEMRRGWESESDRRRWRRK